MGRMFILFIAAATALASHGAAAQRVDVALVLAVDISLSMDREEQRAQRDGYVEAVQHPAFHDAVRRGRHGRIALAYVEWGAPWDQRTTVDWTVIDSAASAAAFAGRLAAAPLTTGRGTSITRAIDYAIALFADAPPAERRVIDISGDGPNNMGGPVLEARTRAMAAGVEINGLPLMLKAYDPVFSVPDLDRYYETCVITGPAAFVLPVTDGRQFSGAIRQKLILELAQAGPQFPGLRPGGIDCTIGEKLYQRWQRSFGVD